MIKTFNQFIGWYVDTLSAKEVTAALDAVGIKPNKREKNIYDVLKSAWKKGPENQQLKISVYFDEQHKETREEISGKSRAECRDELESLVAKFGIKKMAFVLIAHSDTFMKGMGYDLVNERGDEVEPTEDGGKEGLADAGGEAKQDVINIQDGNFNNCGQQGVLKKLEEIAEAFSSGRLTEDLEQIDAAVNKVRESWQEFNERESQRQEYLSEISNSLKQLNERHMELEYFLLLPGFPLDLDRYKNIVSSDYAVVKGLLTDVCGICQDAGLLLAKKDGDILTAQESMNKLLSLGEQLKQKSELLISMLQLPKQPEDSGQKQAEQIEDESTVEFERDIEGPPPHQEDDFYRAVVNEHKPADVQEIALPDADMERVPVELEHLNDVHTIAEEKFDDSQAAVTIDEEESSRERLPEDESQRAVAAETDDAQATAAGAGTAAATAVIERSATTEAPATQAIFSDAEGCFWEAFQIGDLANAYWLLREIEDNHDIAGSSLIGGDVSSENSSQRPAPSWLVLAAFLGKEASWSGMEEKDLFYNISMEYSDHLAVLSEEIGVPARDFSLFLAAVAVRPTLFAPETLAGSWIEKALSLVGNYGDPFAELLKTVLDFSSHGKSLDRRLLQDAVHIDWQERAKLVSVEVTAWRNDARGKRIIFAPATKTLHALAGSESLISEALDVVINNDYAKQKKVADVLDRFLLERKKMDVLIYQTTQQLYKKKARVPVIDGQSLQQIIRTLDQLCKLFTRWLDSVQLGDIQEKKNEWWDKKTRDFQQAFKTCWDAFKHEAAVCPDQEAGIKEKAIRNYALNIFSILRQELDDPLNEQEAAREKKWEQMLSQPLLFLRGAPLDEDGYADIAKPLMSKESLFQAVLERRSLKGALQLHLEDNDFRLARLVIQELQNCGDPQAEELDKDYEELKSRAQIILKEKIDQTRNQIVQATIDHVLTEEVRSELEGRLLSIEEQETDQPFILLQELEEMAKSIIGQREERQISLHDNIKQLSAGLDDRVVVSGEQNNLVSAKKHLARSEAALGNGDLALADEFLHYAERAIDTGLEIEADEETDQVKYVEEFAGVISSLNRYLEAEEKHRPRGPIEMLSKGKPVGGLDMNRVPGARYKEIKSGLEAWLNIKRHKNVRENAGLLGDQLTKLLEYAGFQRPQVEYKDGDGKSSYYAVTMSPGKLSPLADFGSQRNGIYDIVLVYSRPHADTIGNILHTYGVFTNCPLVIFTGRMTSTQRGEWSDYCRREGITSLMVDELLLYYLASQRESRLPALISCGVAWGYSVPYHSFGVIPPEIFKGRNLMVKELAEPGGSCIVYGGRQFGKTVILHMVQREYDNPERGVYVFYDDIKPLGDPQGHYRPEDLWERLREMLIKREILYKGTGHERAQISRKIIEKLTNNKKMRVIILLDESDNFLAADARHNFEQVYELRWIMDQTERRFKVVFCGLHSVQRYCSGKNHPFAQLMSRPLEIGPLEPAEARLLITEPMEAIGFSFNGQKSKDAVLRILCYTNYHPALIQYFCGELIKLVRKRRQEPPYQVEIADVEGVYRREDVRSFMRERFNWTLDLDTRYQVIVYSMIAEQLDDRDGYRREFTVSEALACAACWWPRGFSAVSLDEAKSLLDELIGLGVLVKRINGKYRLKNGNVVRALGSEHEISERLLNMSEQPAPDTDEDVLSCRLKLNGQERSPLTIKQANKLTKACSGVGIVFGSDAVGINAMPDTLRFEMDSNFGERCRQLPPDIVTMDQLLRLFDSSISRKETRCDLFYTYAANIPIWDASLADAICKASRFLSKYGRRSNIVRWIIIFDAVNTRRWFADYPEGWTEIESQMDAVVYLTRWNQVMIRKYLTDLESLNEASVYEKIYEVTGGWPFLLSELWKLAKDPADRYDPRKKAEQLKEKLSENTNGIVDGFIAALGVDEVKYGREIVKMFRELGSIARDEIEEAVRTYDNAELLGLSAEKLRVSLQTLHRLNLLVESERGLVAEPVASGVIAAR